MGHLRMTEDGPAATGRGACMGCMQCAAICPRQAVLNQGQPAVVSRPENELEALIMSRRSIRRYKPEAPDKAIIQWAIQRAAYAPSGKNRHDNRFTVVYGKERVEAVRETALEHCRQTGEAPEIARFLAKGLDLLTCNAPVLILGWSPDDCLNPCVDVAVAMETVELLLVSRGLGTCWGGYMRQLTNHSPALKALLGIPEGCSLQACLMVGHPAGAAFPNIPDRRGADIFWA
jgi:nitroreductase